MRWIQSSLLTVTLLAAATTATTAPTVEGATGSTAKPKPTQPSTITGTPSKPVEDKGSCNSTAGCAALSKACFKVKGHEFTEISPTSGLCTPKKPTQKQTAGAPAAADDLTAFPKDSKDAFCKGYALCNALRQTCKGDYVKLVGGYSGKCIDP